MKTYDRLFGSGPRGALIGALLFVPVYLGESIVALPEITGNDTFRYTFFALLSLISLFVIIWSLKSLPPEERGKTLVTNGAFKYFRHPLYGAFVSFFNFGFVVLMNNWIYMIWALVMIPVWHLNIQKEEALMLKEFGKEYEDYSHRTGRFFFKLRNRRFGTR